MTVVTARRSTAAGFVTIEQLLALAFALVLFVGLANLVLAQYARGVLRASLDDAARAGARDTRSIAHAAASCDASLRTARADLLPGAFADDVELGCEVGGGEIAARAAAVLPSWLPGVPAWRFEDRAVATWEGAR